VRPSPRPRSPTCAPALRESDSAGRALSPARRYACGDRPVAFANCRRKLLVLPKPVSRAIRSTGSEVVSRRRRARRSRWASSHCIGVVPNPASNHRARVRELTRAARAISVRLSGLSRRAVAHSRSSARSSPTRAASPVRAGAWSCRTSSANVSRVAAPPAQVWMPSSAVAGPEVSTRTSGNRCRRSSARSGRVVALRPSSSPAAARTKVPEPLAMIRALRAAATRSARVRAGGGSCGRSGPPGTITVSAPARSSRPCGASTENPGASSTRPGSIAQMRSS
jgi:hypothetical protein